MGAARVSTQGLTGETLHRLWRALSEEWPLTPDVIARAAGAFTVAAVGCILAGWSWLTWSDVLVDFGRELYVPWQLTLGKALYRDVAYFNGPLSPHLNALWFQLFGVSLRTLIFCNLTLLAVLTGLLYHLLRMIGGVFAATVGCLAFLAMFAFGQLVGIANYNFVCPYAHEMTHGLLCSLAVLACLARYFSTRRAAWLLAAGVLTGLVLLTKVEVALACLMAVAGTLGMCWRLLRVRAGERLRLAAAFLASSLLAPLVAWGWLTLSMPPMDAWCSMWAGWVMAANASISSLWFYRWVLGTTNLSRNLLLLAAWTGIYLLLCLPLAFLSCRLPRTSAIRWRHIVAGVASGAAVFAYVFHHQRWGGALADPFRPLPLLMAGLCSWWGVRLMRSKMPSSGLVLRFALAFFALGLLAKMILNTHIYHYGFVLAMPSTMLAIVLLVGWIPAWIAKRGGDGWLFRSVALGWIAVAAFSCLSISAVWFRSKNFKVGHGQDAFFADDRGIEIQKALEWMSARTSPDETVVVLPEGIMMNYLARRTSSIPYVNFMPVEVLWYGEEQMLSALQMQPPTHIVLVHKNTLEYGFRHFGQDYGRELMEWVRRHYEVLAGFGAPPLESDHFGIDVLGRRPSR